MVVLAVAAGVALTSGYFFYLRDSSLVAVTDVQVEGVRSGDREAIIAALEEAGEEMTTLHLEADRLEAAVAAFPTVESVRADADFPHGLLIEVAERPPTVIAQADGREVPIADDGTVLAGLTATKELDLPVLRVQQLPASGRLEGEALDQALVVGATPEELRPLIESIDYAKDYGVVISMEGAIPIRFGPGARGAAKWAAAAAVLADPKLQSLSYVDVRVPERPAAGGATIALTTG